MNLNLRDILYRKEQILASGENTDKLFLYELVLWALSFVIPVLIFPFYWISAIFNDIQPTWKMYADSPAPFIIGFIMLSGKFLYNIFRHYEFAIKKHNLKIEEKLDQHLQKAQIVFENRIRQYDYNHLLALQRLLYNLSPKVRNLYAIDNSDPIQWWSETMTGYLALLSNWKSLDPQRTITRIFVFNEGQLHNILVGKLISLHSYHGMRTFVFSKDQYDLLFNQFRNENNTVDTFRKKEVLTWERPEPSACSTVNINEHIYSKTIGYQSFWEIDWAIEDRQSHDEYYNYYGSPIQREKIKTWFEFVTMNGKHNNYAKIMDNHLDFILYLILNTVCCTESKHVSPIKKGSPFGIQIKTAHCDECQNQCDKKNTSPFEFADNKDINEILKKYVSS